MGFGTIAWLLLLASPLLILLLVIRGGKKKLSVERRAHLSSARPGNARITRVGSVVRHRGPNQTPLFSLSLEVQPAHGDGYCTLAPWYVEPQGLSRAQIGQSVRVLIDAENRHIVYPARGDDWFEYAWEDRPQ